MNSRWMLNAFCNYCENKLNTSFVVRCTSNHAQNVILSDQCAWVWAMWDISEFENLQNQILD